MNILFISLGDLENIRGGSVHIDLMRRFAKEHNVYVICKRERRQCKKTELSEELGIHILHVRTGNIKNTSIIEKGISTILVEPQFKNASKKYFSNIKFDLVIYSTPPITFANVVKYIKNRDNAKSYLLLKDIFPQNAVDLGMMNVSGIKSFIYYFFRKKEEKLYKISDYIGCMSKANVDYLLANNLYIDSNIVEICPNSVEVRDMSVDISTRMDIRKKYGIPQDKKVFIYGGNLGMPQGIDFMIKCLENQENSDEAFFLIVGKGTEYKKIENYIEVRKPKNIKLMKALPKEDYDKMVGACDVGMIFLDHRFTIPNFPSRLLSYMQAKIPVLAVTDPNTDIGKVIVDGGFGWWVESNDVSKFDETIKTILSKGLDDKKNREWDILNSEYSVEKSYEIIMNHCL